jgi:hypothetical protein
MARTFVIALGFLLISPWPGCAPERERYEGPAPRERLILLFPESERHLILEVPAAGGNLDVGVDYDGPADSLALRIASGSSTWEGSRLAGSNMRLVACGIPAEAGRLVIVLRNHRSSSRMAALRVAPHKSDMCTPLVPVMDEFWALRAKSSPPAAEWSR